jgi:5-methyltetrahydrofolate--homocysteine methyltransferase
MLQGGMMADFRARLSESRVIVADGATGTMLQSAGVPTGTAPELLNMERPEVIRGLHRSYIDSGAEAILTNSFGGTRLRLERTGLGRRVGKINLQAAALAREVAGEDLLVFGDIGPIGKMMAPFGDLSITEATKAFAEQAGFLSSGGVDAIFIETMSDLQEAIAAVKGAQQATDLPIIVSMSFDTHGRTMMGVTPEQAAVKLWSLSVDVIGANCGRSLEENLEAIKKMISAVPGASFIAKPNAGLPQVKGGESVYGVTPQTMAEFALEFALMGVKIIGGCCGSTPAHIRTMAAALSRKELGSKERPG